MSLPADSTEIGERLARGSRVALLGLAVNAILAVAKMLAGFLGHSYALVADGVESTLDIFGSLVVVSGLRVAAAPPDRDHPYGHGKAEPLAAFIVSLGLVGAALLLAVGSIKEIVTPHHPPATYTLVVLVAVIIIKEFMFRIAAKKAAETGSHAVQADAWHHRSDAITSIAALIGISIAIIGGDRFQAADEIAALFACGIIAWNGFRLIKPALGELMDTAPSPEIERAVREVAAKVPGVLELDKCHVRKMGLEYYVDLHIRVSGSITVAEGHRIAHLVKDALCEQTDIADVLVHVEPEADETGRSKGLAGT